MEGDTIEVDVTTCGGREGRCENEICDEWNKKCCESEKLRMKLERRNDS